MFSSTQMHHIQRAILLKLASTSYLRFTQLQPPHIPNNTFSYHLKKLLEMGYIELTPHGYMATRKALKITQNVESERHHAQPVSLVVLHITNLQNEVLLIKRKGRPFKDWLGVPSGMIHNGESLKQAAVRELQEKTLVIIKPELLEPKGVLDFRYMQNASNDTFIHAIGFVFTYIYKGPRDLLQNRETQHGVLTWQTLECENILPEVHAVTSLANYEHAIIQSVDFEEPVPLIDPWANGL